MKTNVEQLKQNINSNKLFITKKLAERKQALDDAKRLRDEIKALRKANKHLKQQIKTAEKLDIVDQALKDLK